MILHGVGSSIWVSCHRDDVAAAFVRSLDNPAAVHRCYILASSELLTWNEYWTTVARRIDASEPRFLHIPTDVLHHLAPDLSEWCWENFQYDNILDSAAAERDLGFRSTRNWDEGFREPERREPVPRALAESYDRLVGVWCEHVERMIVTFRNG